MIKGNKGEWSELYVLFRLLADGKLYAADEKSRYFHSEMCRPENKIRHKARLTNQWKLIG